ncbi:sugar transferase [Flavobacterium sp. J372]|uniref:sugar transferase n=1 Tax=Flavobacterium sp. J372 TaxID=2898436 RepID=UPI002151EA5B|nr:sugar transferase [Flavobacterium sp. J372]MCR5861712.1 sugar transferase [Flavobacterium sp. J372]
MRSLLLKRLFDFASALTGLLVFGWIILLVCVLAAIDTASSGIFLQKRIGRYGKPFTIFKLRTIRCDGTISTIGSFLRKFKIDEFPQLLNVLLGDMSLVGPRPDVAGYYDKLQGTDRQLLQLRPGITGLASLKYADEEEILSQQNEPDMYNDKVLFPDKVRLNLIYLRQRNLFLDIKIILWTFAGNKAKTEFVKSFKD